MDLKKSHLVDMFGNVIPNQIIENVCLNNWNMETCVEYLIKYVAQNSSDELSKAQHKDSTNFKSTAITSSEQKNNNSSCQGAIPKDNFSQLNGSKTETPYCILNSICSNINNGYKVMVIMRGPPGSGKSYLANELMERCFERFKVSHHIFSSDNFFYDAKECYKFDYTKLPEAHKWNEKQVLQHAATGWSPIIVDNTNIRVWEMMPYVKIAVQHGYIFEILEPDTPWSKSVTKLAMKNKHGVPKDTIKRMLDSFESTTSNHLIQMLKETKYTVNVPQLRVYPSIQLHNNESYSVQEAFNEIDGPIKKAENIVTSPLGEMLNIAGVNSIETNIANDDWKPYEKDFEQFWSTETQEEITKPQRKNGKRDISNKIANILIDPLAQENGSVKNDNTTQKLQKHELNCPNESKSFVLLREYFPNKLPENLWDLYEKCEGDTDWALSVLNTDSSIDEFVAANYKTKPSQLECQCRENSSSFNANNVTNNNKGKDILKNDNIITRTSPKRSREKMVDDRLQIKREIENQFVLGQEYYSSHLKKVINNKRHDKSISPQCNLLEMFPENGNTPQTTENEQSKVHLEMRNDEEEFVEIDLGRALVDRLGSMFESHCDINIPSQYTTNVFMPMSLAKQLYVIWMESVYNQIEEQRQTIVKEDSEFAKMLEDPKYCTRKSSPNTYAEILDMELAWKLYTTERNMESWRYAPPTNLASHLTRMKLCELFPNIDNDILYEILAAHNNNFSDTVEVLKNSMKEDVDEKMTLTKESLLEIVRSENQKVQGPGEICDLDTKSVAEKMSSDEIKKMALKDFEESRNLAVHHSQLKAECYLKAKEAIQKGNSAVAVYYSQIANLHKSKIDSYNQKAANCIVEVHDQTQNNPDFIDLHYLHVLEAIECLDIFIDKNITKMKNILRSYKHIFIITGRGLHSAGGVSAIKNRVKSRLKERNLKWTEVNPGLLKVKVFSASKYSKNI